MRSNLPCLVRFRCVCFVSLVHLNKWGCSVRLESETWNEGPFCFLVYRIRPYPMIVSTKVKTGEYFQGLIHGIQRPGYYSEHILNIFHLYFDVHLASPILLAQTLMCSRCRMAAPLCSLVPLLLIASVQQSFLLVPDIFPARMPFSLSPSSGEVSTSPVWQFQAFQGIRGTATWYKPQNSKQALPQGEVWAGDRERLWEFSPSESEHFGTNDSTQSGQLKGWIN